MHLAVNARGIPHLAKNERDMGHPSLARERGVVRSLLTSVIRQTSYGSLPRQPPLGIPLPGVRNGSRYSFPSPFSLHFCLFVHADLLARRAGRWLRSERQNRSPVHRSRSFHAPAASHNFLS